MAGASAAITGAGSVLEIDALLTTDAAPGTFWAKVSPTSDVPETGISVVLFARNVTMTWTDCRLSKRPTVTRGGAVVVIEDSRWRLRTVSLSRAFNQPTLDGRVEFETSLADVWAHIATLADIAIRTESLPGITPPLSAGMRCDEAVQSLLDRTVCRMGYDALTQEYVVSPAGSGTLPSTAERLRRPVYVEKPASIDVVTAPNLYESEITCNAVVVDSDGSLINMAANAEFDLHDIFKGFEDEADARREVLRNSAYRVWRPASADDIRIMGYRIQSIGPGTQSAPQAIAIGMLNLPGFHYTPTDKAYSLANIRYVEDGGVFIADTPVIAHEGGTLRTQVGILCAYQQLDADGAPLRETETRAIAGATGPVKTIVADWIHPVESESTKDGVDETQWQAKLDAVADAQFAKYSAVTECARIRSLVPTGGVGLVGAVRYRAMLGPLSTLETTLAINYVPSGATQW